MTGSAGRRADLLDGLASTARREGRDGDAAALAAQAGAWRAGETGERAVGAVLDRIAASEPEAWRVLHDRLLDALSGSRANIDHLVVGPGGVVVVDAKRWAGTVVATPARLCADGQDRTGQVESLSAAADLVASKVGGRTSAVLCLDRPVSAGVTPMLAGVAVLALPDLEAWVRSRPACFDHAAVAAVAARLDALFPPAETAGPETLLPCRETPAKAPEQAAQRQRSAEAARVAARYVGPDRRSCPRGPAARPAPARPATGPSRGRHAAPRQVRDWTDTQVIAARLLIALAVLAVLVKVFA